MEGGPLKLPRWNGDEAIDCDTGFGHPSISNGDTKMRLAKTIAAALLAGSVLAAPAVAMEPMMMKDSQAMVIKPNGESMMFDTDSAMMTEAMAAATPVEEGMIFFMQDGKMMMTKDTTMDGGKMMSDSMMKMSQ